MIHANVKRQSKLSVAQDIVRSKQALEIKLWIRVWLKGYRETTMERHELEHHSSFSLQRKKKAAFAKWLSTITENPENIQIL